jgi:hypothetical protein
MGNIMVNGIPFRKNAMFYSITKKRNPIKFNYTLHGHSLEHVT